MSLLENTSLAEKGEDGVVRCILIRVHGEGGWMGAAVGSSDRRGRSGISYYGADRATTFWRSVDGRDEGTRIEARRRMDAPSFVCLWRNTTGRSLSAPFFW